jgi:hypothetical protein
MMAVKGNKLYPDDIHGIRYFTMAYKGLVTFVIAYKELALVYYSVKDVIQDFSFSRIQLGRFV